MNSKTVKSKELTAARRISDFNEVVLGYDEKETLEEAQRCLQCKNPACTAGCPVGIDIKKFIAQIVKKDYKAAYMTIRDKNDFPSICGRVCPAEYQCRKACVLTKKGMPFASADAINIHFLERFAGDYGIKNKLEAETSLKANLSKYKVAVIGSGPAGLACAGELARAGTQVTIYESLHKMGGVLRYGIPPFRLHRDVLDYEIDYLKKLGVKFAPNIIVGKAKTLDELFSEGYACIFLGLGAGKPSFLGLNGENLCNIYSANEFLTRVNLMSAYKFPEFHTPANIGNHVIVVGGGNTAMDSARVALRLQKISKISPDTTIIYRRTEIEMPARRLEIEHAKEEGIKFKFLTQPVEFLGDERGFVRKIRCLECRLGEKDSSGRQRPIPIKESDFEIDCDLAIIAVGLKANEVLTNATPKLKIDEESDIVVNPKTMETSIKNVYAGGDIVGGEGTVIEAMGMAKIAAASIIERLTQNRS